MLKKFFPFSFGLNEVKDLVIRVIILVVVGSVVSSLLALLPNLLIPEGVVRTIVGGLLSVVGSLCGIYCTASVVFCFLSYFKVIKD